MAQCRQFMAKKKTAGCFACYFRWLTAKPRANMATVYIAMRLLYTHTAWKPSWAHLCASCLKTTNAVCHCVTFLKTTLHLLLNTKKSQGRMEACTSWKKDNDSSLRTASYCHDMSHHFLHASSQQHASFIMIASHIYLDGILWHEQCDGTTTTITTTTIH